MKKFNSIEEAKIYGQDKNAYNLFDDDVYLGLNALRAYAKKEKQNIILCETCKEYEDKIWSDIYESIEKFYKIFGIMDDIDKIDDITDLTSEIRDLIIKRFEKDTNIKFINAYDNF